MSFQTTSSINYEITNVSSQNAQYLLFWSARLTPFGHFKNIVMLIATMVMDDLMTLVKWEQILSLFNQA